MDYYALVDVNNFYVSCERLFDPRARARPAIVLSNNDGCAIARSEEAKALGIAMGAPLFEIQNIVLKNNVHVYSSNYCLYGDLSARVMQVLRTFTPSLEVYSIDESFLLFRNFAHVNMEDYAKQIRDTVYTFTGLPVSVGVGTTKTLAKVANHLAKRHFKTNALCLLEGSDIDAALKLIEVQKIWGIGRRRAQWLRTQGAHTAYDLKNMPDRLIKKKMTVTGLRTVWELRGTSCLKLEELDPEKKAVGCSRMFGYPVESFTEMREALCAYMARAAVKLRRQHLLAGYVHIHIETSRFRTHYYKNALGCYVNPPSAFTPLLTQYAAVLLKEIYRADYKYQRVGVLLTDLVSERAGQQYFIDPLYAGTKYQTLMQTIDRYNSTVNHGKIQFAAEGFGKPWHMKQLRKSKRFTTNWNELLEIEV